MCTGACMQANGSRQDGFQSPDRVRLRWKIHPLHVIEPARTASFVPDDPFHFPLFVTVLLLHVLGGAGMVAVAAVILGNASHGAVDLGGRSRAGSSIGTQTRHEVDL